MITDEEISVIKSLKHKEEFVVPESDYGKAIVCRMYDFYVLFTIPTFGGNPQYSDTFPLYRFDDMINMIEGWC